MSRDIVSIETGCSSVSLEADGIELRTKSGVVRIPWRDVKAAALAGRDRQEMPDPAVIAGQMKQLQSLDEGTSSDWAGLMKSMQLNPPRDDDPATMAERMRQYQSQMGQTAGTSSSDGTWKYKTVDLNATFDPQAMPDPALMAEGMKRWQSQMKSVGRSLDWAEMFKSLELAANHDPLWIVRRNEIYCVLIESSGPERDALLTGLRARLRGRWLGENFTREQLEKRFCRWGFKRTFRVVRTLVLLFSAVILLVVVWTMVVYGLPIATQGLFTLLYEELLAGEWNTALIVGILLAGFLLLGWVVKRRISRSRYRQFWTGP
jgi:hypothetical protein